MTKISIGEFVLIFPILNFLLFFVLKLFGLVAWSWLWILSPLWIPASIIGSIVIFAIIMLIAYTNAKYSP